MEKKRLRKYDIIDVTQDLLKKAAPTEILHLLIQTNRFFPVQLEISRMPNRTFA